MPGAQPSARERLLRATAELTYAGGIEATGVDAIARAAGVTKRTLYQHFRSKDELVGAALALRDAPALEGLRAAVERRVARGDRPVDALFAVLGRVFAAEGYRGCAFVNASLEVADAAHPVHAVTRSQLSGRAALVADLCRAEGVVEPSVIEGVRLLVEGAFVLSAAGGDPEAAARAGLAARRLVDSR